MAEITWYVLAFLLLLGLFAVAGTQGSSSDATVGLFVRLVAFVAELLVLLVALVAGVVAAALTAGPLGLLALGVLLFITLFWKDNENFVVFSLIFLGLLLLLF